MIKTSLSIDRSHTHGKTLRPTPSIVNIYSIDMTKYQEGFSAESHSIRFLFSLVILALLRVPALAQTMPQLLVSYPDVILHNGKIVTMDDKSTSTNPGTIRQAVAIRDGKILVVGNNQPILSLKGPQTKIVDLKGRTVVPGIIDTHSHLYDYALDTQDKASVRTRIRAKPGETWESIKQRTFEQLSRKWARRSQESGSPSICLGRRLRMARRSMLSSSRAEGLSTKTNW